jgi:hypothetical protein
MNKATRTRLRRPIPAWQQPCRRGDWDRGCDQSAPLQPPQETAACRLRTAVGAGTRRLHMLVWRKRKDGCPLTRRSERPSGD